MNFGLILFACVVLLHSIGQTLEKYGMTQVGQIGDINQLLSFHTALRVFTNPYVLGGIALSAIGLMLWLGVLSNLNVSYIYPFGAISYIILAVLAYFILKEDITATRWTGIIIVIIGCYLINR